MAFMEKGTVAEIVIGPEEGRPVRRVDEARAVVGMGLEGDRYFLRHQAGEHDAEDEITLIAIEGIEAAAEEAGLDLETIDLRRNIVTRGIELDDLVGSTLHIGEVEVEALAANPPCRYLQELAGKPLLKPMIARGGIRGRIVRGGIIKVGDSVMPAP